MASILGKFTKTDVERKQYTIDYSSWLGDAEVLTGVQAIIDKIEGPDDTTPMFVEAVVLGPDLMTATLMVDDGTVDVVYIVTLLAHTTITQLKEDGIQITITAGVVE
jgi:hypothetical protein